jgi:hypothetical protein
MREFPHLAKRSNFPTRANFRMLFVFVFQYLPREATPLFAYRAVFQTNRLPRKENLT